MVRPVRTRDGREEFGHLAT